MQKFENMYSNIYGDSNIYKIILNLLQIMSMHKSKSAEWISCLILCKTGKTLKNLKK